MIFSPEVVLGSAQLAMENGVEVVRCPDGEVQLYSGEVKQSAVLQGASGIVMLFNRVSDRIAGLVLVDAENWSLGPKGHPVLCEIWKQYKAADSQDSKHDATVRLFHAALCCALPQYAAIVVNLYPER